MLKALFQCSQSQNAAHRESAFRIFASVPELISDQHTDTLKNVFMGSLTDAESQAVSNKSKKKKKTMDKGKGSNSELTLDLTITIFRFVLKP